ncbi:MAG TPA: FAD-binding oxidoreductase [Acidimicrobiia bacterium]|nr:FAD-binding oxidoreductase [Acidimicrobiia bacterium]
MTRTADIVIVGAGIAGVSAAYHLSVRHGIDNVVLVDPRPPLTLTSDKSTECYRNWWPNRPMVGLMNRSIDVFEELAEEIDFGFNRNGYLFVTRDGATLTEMAGQIEKVAALGADAELLDASDLRRDYGFLNPDSVGAVKVRRAGWLRAQDLGQWMLERARDAGATLIPIAVTSITREGVELSDGSRLAAPTKVLAAGPLSVEVGAMAGLELPLFSELHLKVSFKDHLGVIPRTAPMTIWSDPQSIDWSQEERLELEAMGRHDVLGEMPVFCHFRPEGGTESPYFVALWEYHGAKIEPTWPLPEDPLYPEVVMRGLATMVPGLMVYLDRLPAAFVDGGYYTKTVENRPLIGPSGVEGVHLLAGLSGFGVMVSAGAADLLARHIVGAELPDYAPAFLLSRYEDPDYLPGLESADSGQL